MLNDKETYYILYERHFKILSEDDWIKSIFPIDAFSSWVKYEDIITFGAMVRTEFVNQNLNVEKIISDWFIKALNWNRITTAIYTVFDVVKSSPKRPTFLKFVRGRDNNYFYIPKFYNFFTKRAPGELFDYYRFLLKEEKKI